MSFMSQYCYGFLNVLELKHKIVSNGFQICNLGFQAWKDLICLSEKETVSVLDLKEDEKTNKVKVFYSLSKDFWILLADLN